MTILYESLGSFNTGSPSYRSLISKRSRGTITLNEKIVSFESEVDKIVFNVKLSEIQDFFMRFHVFIPFVELNTINKTTYALYPLRKRKNLYSSSLIMTEELFRQLVRVIYIKDQAILFDAIGILYPGSIQSITLKEINLTGHIFLTENYILFKAFQIGDMSSIKIVDIKLIIIEIVDSTRYITIKTLEGRVFSFIILKEKRRKFVKDKIKTEKFYDVLNNAKIYKDSEKLIKVEQGKKGVKCLFCGNIINPDEKTCPYCGNNT
ncbi:MAG: zinc ribbon domain-containing protein [Candidatus Thorarchaeota archaeon]